MSILEKALFKAVLLQSESNFMHTDQSGVSGIRVGVLTYDYDPPIGGLGVLAQTYVRALRQLYPASVFTVISPGRRADDRGSALGRFRWRKSGGCPLFSLSLLFSLPSIIRRHHLDVLHVHAGSGGVFLLRKPRCPLVVTSHHTYRQESAIVFDRSPLTRLWKRFMSRLEMRTYRLADLICCVSTDTKTEILEHYGIPESKVIVVENPVPTDVLSRFRQQPKEKDTILFVGRLEERKGIMLLLKAFHALSKDLPGLRLRLVGRNLIGDRLDGFLGSHRLEERVTSLGHVHDPYRFREMARATVLVVPSRLEGFGLVAAEGMMLGTCVIASDAPGLRSIVEDGKTGRTFRSGDLDDFIRVMREVLSDADGRKRLETQAREIAEHRFSVQARAEELMEAFMSVAAG